MTAYVICQARERLEKTQAQYRITVSGDVKSKRLGTPRIVKKVNTNHLDKK